MKPIIKRTKQPDVLEHRGTINISARNNNIVLSSVQKPMWQWFSISLPEAKELSKVLPKFLEEMER